jgi:2'-5' RNA ligase
VNKGGMFLQYFIGVVPPESYKKKVELFRSRWENHRINKAVEPHITLKAQGGLTPDEEWITKVKEVCESFPTFDMTIGKPKFFIDNILYLSIEAEQLSVLHEKIVRAINPSSKLIKQYFELDDFVPHMSLGKTFYGMSKQELIDMAQLAEEELTPYPTFKVDYIRIYREVEPQLYEEYMDIPLSI